jgi:hypothetical protein
MFAYKNNIDPPPIFNTGDEVEFEVARGTNYARWDYHRENNINNDLGPSGLWAQGVVVDSSDYEVSDLDHSKWIYIRYEIEGMIGAGYLAFPRPSNPAYHEWQWKREGFLRKNIIQNAYVVQRRSTELTQLYIAFGVKRELRKENEL